MKLGNFDADIQECFFFLSLLIRRDVYVSYINYPHKLAGDGTPVADRGSTHGGGGSARRSTRQNANRNNQPR